MLMNFKKAYKKYKRINLSIIISLAMNSRIRVKIFVNEITSVNSIVAIFKNANSGLIRGYYY